MVTPVCDKRFNQNCHQLRIGIVHTSTMIIRICDFLFMFCINFGGSVRIVSESVTWHPAFLMPNWMTPKLSLARQNQLLKLRTDREDLMKENSQPRAKLAAIGSHASWCCCLLCRSMQLPLAAGWLIHHARAIFDPDYVSDVSGTYIRTSRD